MTRKFNIKTSFLIVFTAFAVAILPSISYAISPEQRALFDSGINFFDIDPGECVGGSITETPVSVVGTTLDGAEQIGAFTGEQMVPTSIILHWTAGNFDSPQQLVDILSSRVDEGYPNGRAVQLAVDQDGKIYQLSETLETKPIQTMNDDPSWNDSSIAIEIESGSFGEDIPAYENDLLNNEVQYNSVLNLVKELMSRYSIQNVADKTTKQGIFGHYEANSGHSDPGPNYMAKIRADIGSEAVSSEAPAITASPSVTNGCVCSAGSSSSSLAGGSNPEKVFNFFLSKGFDANQAAGVTGNAMAESGPDIDPTIVSPSGYTGIFQWDKDNRWPRLVTWARENNKDEYELLTQLEFSWVETEERGIDVAMKEQSSVELAAWYWGRYFEIAIIGGSTSEVPLTNVQALDERIEYAKEVLANFGGNVSNTTISSGGNCTNGGVSVNADGFHFPLITTKSELAAGSSNPSGTGIWNPTCRENCHHSNYNAADIHVPEGVVVIAAKSGTVVSKTEESGRTGSRVTIKSDEDGLVYFYTHMKYNSLLVERGDKVEAGQELGQVGDYLQAEGTAPHLHFDVLPASYDFRPSCSSAACAAYPFINIAPVLGELFEGLPD